MIHGVHYPQDVIVGFTIALVFFALFNLLYEPCAHWLRSLALSRQLLLIVFVLIVLFIAVLLGYELPEQRKRLLSIIAAMAGAAIGISLELRYLKFVDQGHLMHRVMRSILGLASVILLYMVSSVAYYLVVGDKQGIWTFMLYVLRYGVVGIWITFAVPWLLHKCRLLSARQ